MKNFMYFGEQKIFNMVFAIELFFYKLFRKNSSAQSLKIPNDLTLLREIANQTLSSVYQQIDLDSQSNIPLIIRLFEHPTSPIALPGKISLHNHDCLHILLGIGVDPKDEAFIIGFTMGNDDRVKAWHVRLFKFLSRFIYPPKYRFTVRELDIFNRGFKYGKSLKYRNLNKIKFEEFYDITIEDIRHLFGIDRQAYIHLISA